MTDAQCIQQVQPSSSQSISSSLSSSISSAQLAQQTNALLTKPSTLIQRPSRNKSSSSYIDHNANMKNMGIPSRSSHNNQNNNHQNVVSNENNFVYQMGMARNQSMNSPHSKSDDYDPDSNVYVANLPSDYGKDALYSLFSTYGQIVRYKFVTPEEPTQPGYGFVQFQSRKDAHRAIKNLEGHVFSTGETIYLSIALRRRSSLSDEPTNLYVKNLPSSWTNEKLRKVFGAYGSIRQSKVVGDGIAFVRFEDHDQALNAIGRLDKQMVDQGCKLEVRFATRKTAANAYRLQQVPQSKSNENNLYIRNLPKYYNQHSLEELFANYGKISSAKINDNGIAFVRFAHPEDAKRAIQELNGKKPPQFEEEIVVKLAHFDIGDSRNRWANKFGSSAHTRTAPNAPLNGMNGMNAMGMAQFNQNMYQNHFNAPIGTHSVQFQHPFNGSNQNNNLQNNDSHSHSNDLNNINAMNNMSAANGGGQHSNNNGATCMMGQLQMNNQLLQQQMQQWSLNGAQNGQNSAALSQFSFPTANPAMMAMTTPSLFNQTMTNSNPSQQQQQPTAITPNGLPLTTTALLNHASNGSNLSNNGIPGVGINASSSPKSQASNGSNEKMNASANSKLWSKKEQKLGDQLYEKVLNHAGSLNAPKITGMLLKMGNVKAQQCIDSPTFLEGQIQIAKKLLETNEGVKDILSPTAMATLVSNHSNSPKHPSLQRINSPNAQLLNGHSNPTKQQFQALNTNKPLSPNNLAPLTSPHTPNQKLSVPLNGASNALSSVPNLLTASIPNSLYGTMPIFGTPQLFAMSPQSANNGNGQNSNLNLNGNTTPNRANKSLLNSSIPNSNGFVYTMQNLVTSPNNNGRQQQSLYNLANGHVTPDHNGQHNASSSTNGGNDSNIQQSGWGLAVNPSINMIQTQPATNFMQPSFYARTSQ